MAQVIAMKCPQCKRTDFLVYDRETDCWRCPHCFNECIPGHEPEEAE